MRKRLAALRGPSVGLVDQAVASLSNVLLVVAVARTSSAEQTGTFSLAYLVFAFGLGLARATIGDASILRPAPGEGKERRLTRAHLSGLLVLFASVGALLGIGLGLVAWLTGDRLIGGLAVGALFGLVLEAYRYRGIGAGRYASVLGLDACWLLLVAAAWLWAPGGRGTAITWYWAAAALATLVLAACSVQRPCLPSELGRFVTGVRPYAKGAAADFLVAKSATYIVYYVLGATIGVAAVGALRVAEVVLGPVNTALQAAQTVGLAELARRRRVDVPSPGGAVLAGSLLLGAGAVALCLALLALPESALRSLFGESTRLVRSVLLPLAVSKGLGAVAIGAVVLLRVEQRPGQVARVRSISGVAQLVAAVGLSVVAGLQGAAWGLVGGALCTAVLMWAALLRASGHGRSQRRSAPPVAGARETM
jgi:O-antigen/teichoic acid export membrane protein